MTFTATEWPLGQDVDRAHPGRRHGATSVCRRELLKLARLVRVQAVLAACVLAPFVVAAGISVQSAVPADTLFGQWVHQSGVALAMVVLGFCGQWALPALVAIVAGDVFSAEDHLGTWKTVLTRSRSRGEIFAGKVLAVLVWCVVDARPAHRRRARCRRRARPAPRDRPRRPTCTGRYRLSGWCC